MRVTRILQSTLTLSIFSGVILTSLPARTATEYHHKYTVQNKTNAAINVALYVYHSKGRQETQPSITSQPNQSATITNTDGSKFYAEYSDLMVNGSQCLRYANHGSGDHLVTVANKEVRDFQHNKKLTIISCD